MAIRRNTKTQSGRASDKLVEEKLAAFARIENEFRACFRFKEEVHGQRRLAVIPVADSVRYLHALWVCECKDDLLSVPQTMGRYEGKYCLELLRDWQNGDTPAVIAFLHRKLDNLPFADLTRQISEAQMNGNAALAQRLRHGRGVLLNRGLHLMYALDAIFALDDAALLKEVRAACRRFKHTPEQITRQLADLETPLYSYKPHPLLAQRNMQVMNALGITVMDARADQPGNRTARVATPTLPQPPYAQQVITSATTLMSMAWNNPRHSDLANPPVITSAVEMAEDSSQAPG